MALMLCRNLPDMVTALIPNKAAAANIVRECQSAILVSSSSLTRNTAFAIMRAVAHLAFNDDGWVVRTAAHAGQQPAASDFVEADRQQQAGSEIQGPQPQAQQPQATVDTTELHSHAEQQQQQAAEAVQQQPGQNHAGQAAELAGLFNRVPVDTPQPRTGSMSAPSATAATAHGETCNALAHASASDATGVPIGGEATALAQRQQTANRAIDDLFAEIGSGRAEDRGAAALAAAAGTSSAATALRQQTVNTAMQDLFEEAVDETQPAGAAGLSHHSQPTGTQAHEPMTDNTAAGNEASGSSSGLGAFSGLDLEHSVDEAASWQEALDRAIDEMIFEHRNERNSDTNNSEHSVGSSSSADSSNSHAAEPGPSASSAPALAEAMQTSAEQGAQLELQANWQRALQALQLQQEAAQPSQPASAWPGGTEGTKASGAADGTPVSSGPNRAEAARAARPVVGLPSLSHGRRPTQWRAGVAGSEDAAGAADRHSAGAQHSGPGIRAAQAGDAEVQEAFRNLMEKMREAQEGPARTYQEGHNLLEYLPGSQDGSPLTRDAIEDFLCKRDCLPRRLIDEENDRAGHEWRRTASEFYAVVSEYRHGHAISVKEQTECRQEVGFPLKQNQKRKWFTTAVRGAVVVAAAAVTGGLVTRRIHWHSNARRHVQGLHEASAQAEECATFQDTEDEQE